MHITTINQQHIDKLIYLYDNEFTVFFTSLDTLYNLFLHLVQSVFAAVCFFLTCKHTVTSFLTYDNSSHLHLINFASISFFSSLLSQSEPWLANRSLLEHEAKMSSATHINTRMMMLQIDAKQYSHVL